MSSNNSNVTFVNDTPIFRRVEVYLNGYINLPFFGKEKLLEKNVKEVTLSEVSSNPHRHYFKYFRDYYSYRSEVQEYYIHREIIACGNDLKKQQSVIQVFQKVEKMNDEKVKQDKLQVSMFKSDIKDIIRKYGSYEALLKQRSLCSNDAESHQADKDYKRVRYVVGRLKKRIVFRWIDIYSEIEEEDRELEMETEISVSSDSRSQQITQQPTGFWYLYNYVSKYVGKVDDDKEDDTQVSLSKAQ